MTKRKVKTMSNLHTPETDEFFRAILTLESVDECCDFFEDVCTAKEIIEISQRLKVARMLRAGINYNTICKETGVSTATISRVSKCLENGNGYKRVLCRMDGEQE